MNKLFLIICSLFLSVKTFAAIIYVNVNATGANDGTSWNNAFTDLQSALSIAFINDDIWVAKGTYKPTQSTDRTLSFVMKNGVDMFGGFNGTEGSISERNLDANPTYLSGDIGAIGDNTDNSYKIVKVQNFTTPFIFDGFRIVSGYDASSSGKGAGMYVFNNPGIQITINNTIIYNNYAYHSGGGMIIDNSNTTFNTCEFLYNSSFNYGGGAIYSANVSNSKIYLNDCKFIGNNSRQGPVINFDGLELVMERNFISSNTSTTSGNIINVSHGPTKFQINNSLIVGNQVADGGSSIISSYTSGQNSSSLTNVTICHNKNNTSLDVYAEAIYQSNSAMIISNCIVFGNTNSDLNVQIDAGNSVRNSIVENGYSTGINVINANPLFTNPGSLSMAPFDASNFDYSLLEGSPAVNFGNNLYAQDFSLDFLKNTRIQQMIVDCGAIESPYSDTQTPVASCNNVILNLNSSGEANLAVSLVDNNSSDNIGIVNYVLSQTSFNCFEIGLNIVQLTVYDKVGNSSSCDAEITVVDIQSPTIQTQNISVFLNENGITSITVDQVDTGTSDNCSLDTMYLSMYDFTCADAGSNVVTFTAVDVNGNEVSSTFTVEVIDSVLPTVIGQNLDVYLNSNGQVSITAAQVDNGSYDDCGIATMSLSLSNFNCSTLGLNQISFLVYDFYGNVSSIPVEVTVHDTLKPITNGQSITRNLAISNPINITPTDINLNSSDNCSFNQSVSPSTFTEVGIYDVLLSSTDLSGNTSSEIYTVTVINETQANVEEANNFDFHVYPNPTAGQVKIFIENGANLLFVRLYDLSGKLLSNYQFVGDYEVDIEVNQSSGVYLLELESSNHAIQKVKIVKI